MIAKQDRTYWRAESTRRLIEEGKASGNELAIALAERLEKATCHCDCEGED